MNNAKQSENFIDVELRLYSQQTSFGEVYNG